LHIEVGATPGGKKKRGKRGSREEGMTEEGRGKVEASTFKRSGRKVVED